LFHHHPHPALLCPGCPGALNLDSPLENALHGTRNGVPMIITVAMNKRSTQKNPFSVTLKLLWPEMTRFGKVENRHLMGTFTVS